MRRFSSKDVEKTTLERCLPWLFGFALCAVIVLGYVRLYELELENEKSQIKVVALTEELGELKKQKAMAERELQAQAQALGYDLPKPEDIVVVHVGREDPPQTAEP